MEQSALVLYAVPGMTLISQFYFLYCFSCLQDFVDQFRVLLPKNTTSFKEDISALLGKKMALDPTTYQIGKTKVH